MSPRQKVGIAFAIAAVMTGIGGGIAAAHSMSAPAPQGPALNAPANDPVDPPDAPGQPDLPEPGDVPDGPGH
jgi:hypothetical protein